MPPPNIYSCLSENFIVQSTDCNNGYFYIGTPICRKISPPPQIPSYATGIMRYSTIAFSPTELFKNGLRNKIRPYTVQREKLSLRKAMVTQIKFLCQGTQNYISFLLSSVWHILLLRRRSGPPLTATLPKLQLSILLFQNKRDDPKMMQLFSSKI